MPTIPFSKKHGPRFKTGAKPSPRHKLSAATPFTVAAFAPPPPAEFAVVPEKLDPWGNQTYGDCVTAEVAFTVACYYIINGGSEIFIDPKIVIDWARKHGVLNGAGLSEVNEMMDGDGFKVGSQRYDGGPASTVNWTDPATLRAAIYRGVVKIAIPASCLPSGAGSQQGWYVTSTRGGRTDHCVSLQSYGSAGFLFDALKVPLPSKLSKDTPGYHLYTWATIGFVTQDWVDAALDEAWVRDPTTVGVPPLPAPTPPPLPGPVKNPTITGILASSSKITGEVTLDLPVPTSGKFTYIAKKTAGGYGLVKKPVA